MIVLGFNGGFKRPEDHDVEYYLNHDAAAALMRDGEIIAAVEEERFDRNKHSNCFPTQAINHCLKSAGLTLPDVDLIVAVGEPSRLALSAQWYALENPTVPVPVDAAAYIGSLFEREFDLDLRHKLRFCDHHEAHLWSAFSLSGFEEALVLSIDGQGDARSGVVCVGRGKTITQLRDYPIAQSLGLFHSSTIQLIGYGNFDDYKSMGLAPYGDPAVFKHLFEAGYRLLEGGDFSLDSLSQWVRNFGEANLLQQARRKGEPFLKIHQDLAAGLQQMLEDVAMHLLRHFRQETGCKRLCMAGGVAHNCTLNGKILRSGLFEKVFVQPASHDAGGSLGAACWAMTREYPEVKIRPLRHVYLGPEAGGQQGLFERLKLWSGLIDIEEYPGAILGKTAALLAGGAVIGWVQGRSEFGPRALGNRSILADPRPAGNKDLINAMVKKREQFRPFAPSVVKERAGEYFEIPECEADLSYMTYTLSVREKQRANLGAITHIDGTARVQTVARETNPRFWGLLTEFGKLTGIPILLNTSFNNNAEPIVESVEDAIVCFLTTGIEFLVVGDYLVRKKSSVTWQAYLPLKISCPPTRQLVKSKGAAGPIYRIENTKGNHHGKRSTKISAEMYVLLSRDEECASLGDLLERAGIKDLARRQAVVEEVRDLWTKRMVRLTTMA